MIAENILFKTAEDRWGKIRIALDEHQDLAPFLLNIIRFVVTQSLRTPKFIKSYNERLKRLSQKYEKIDDAYLYSVLHIRDTPILIENCVCEILKINDTANFITSDNPATHWFRNKPLLDPYNDFLIHDRSSNNLDHQILCPLHPKYFAKLTPNIKNNVPEVIKNGLFIREVTNDSVDDLNEKTKIGADKMIFAKNLRDYVNKRIIVMFVIITMAEIFTRLIQ